MAQKWVGARSALAADDEWPERSALLRQLGYQLRARQCVDLPPDPFSDSPSGVFQSDGIFRHRRRPQVGPGTGTRIWRRALSTLLSWRRGWNQKARAELRSVEIPELYGVVRLGGDGNVGSTDQRAGIGINKGGPLRTGIPSENVARFSDVRPGRMLGATYMYT